MELQKKKPTNISKPTRLLSDREIDWNLDSGIKIGEGSYGIVYKFENINFKVYDDATKTTKIYRNIAVKYSDIINNEIDRESLSELCFLTAVKHPNVTHLLDVYIYNNKLGIILPLAQTNLFTIIKTNRIVKDRKIIADDIWNIVYQMLRGCYALQSSNVLHGDYKPENYLVFIEDECVRVAISDFGISTYTECLETNNEGEVFTLGYRPPELMFKSSRYTTKGDTWALACTIYELIMRQPLFYDYDETVTDKSIIKSIVYRLGVPDYENGNKELMQYAREVKDKKESQVVDLPTYLARVIPKEYKSINKLLLKMLVLDPEDRIDIEDILEDIFNSETYIPSELVLAKDRIEGMKCQQSDLQFKTCMVRLTERQFSYPRIVIPLDDRFDMLILLYGFDPPLPNDIVMKTITIFDIFCFRYLKDGNQIDDKEIIDYLRACLHLVSLDHYFFSFYDLLHSEKDYPNNKQRLLIKVLQVLSYLQFDLVRTTSYDLLFYMCKKYNDPIFTNVAIDYLYIMNITHISGLYKPKDIAKACINLAGRYVGFKEIPYPETTIVTIERKFVNELITDPLKTKLIQATENTLSLLSPHNDTFLILAAIPEVRDALQLIVP